MTTLAAASALAQRADDDFSAAIRRVFGPKATRWTYPHGVCAEVDAAREHKLRVDEALQAEWDDYRKRLREPQFLG